MIGNEQKHPEKKTGSVKIAVAAGCFAKKGAAPALGKAFEAIVPAEAQEAFLAFAAKKPRLAAILAKKGIKQKDKEEIKAAYAAFSEERKQEQNHAAIVKVEAAGLAPLLGMSEEETGDYLELYNPQQLKQLAVVAQTQGLEAKDVVSVDAALLEDGSYLGRETETITVSGVHGALAKLIKEEVSRCATRKAVEAEDRNLDKLWVRLLKENDGDEEKAAAQYAVKAAEVLAGAEKKAVPNAEQILDTQLVVELFKLFNYDRQDIYLFLEYVDNNFSLKAGSSFGDGVEKVFEDMLADYIHENRNTVVLNDRSALYQKARTRQLTSMVEVGEIEAGALVELGSPSEEQHAASDTKNDEDGTDADALGMLSDEDLRTLKGPQADDSSGEGSEKQDDD
jgi:hypothetical protein